MTHCAIIITRAMMVMRNTILHEVRRRRNKNISKKEWEKGIIKGKGWKEQGRREVLGKDEGREKNG